MYHFASSLSALQSNFLMRMKPFFFLANGVIYTLLLVIIIVYIALPTSYGSLGTCSSGSTTNKAKIVALVYKVIVSVIALIITIPFLTYGARLLYSISKSMKGSTHKQLLLKFLLVTITCSVALIAQCALLLYTSFASDISTVAALIVAIIVELIPGMVLILTVRVPDNRPWLASFFWCIPFKSVDSDTNKTTADTASRGFFFQKGSRGASSREFPASNQVSNADSGVTDDKL